MPDAVAPRERGVEQRHYAPLQGFLPRPTGIVHRRALCHQNRRYAGAMAPEQCRECTAVRPAGNGDRFRLQRRKNCVHAPDQRSGSFCIDIRGDYVTGKATNTFSCAPGVGPIGDRQLYACEIELCRGSVKSGDVVRAKSMEQHD